MSQLQQGPWLPAGFANPTEGREPTVPGTPPPKSTYEPISHTPSPPSGADGQIFVKKTFADPLPSGYSQLA